MRQPYIRLKGEELLKRVKYLHFFSMHGTFLSFRLLQSIILVDFYKKEIYLIVEGKTYRNGLSKLKYYIWCGASFYWNLCAWLSNMNYVSPQN